LFHRGVIHPGLVGLAVVRQYERVERDCIAAELPTNVDVTRVINGDGELYLPEWDDWGGLFVDGAKIVGISFVSALPLIIIVFAGQGLLMAASIVPALVAETAGGEAASVLAMVSSLLGIGGGFAVFGATIVLSLAMGILVPVITGHVIATGEFAAAFRVREWWPIFRANVGG